MSVNFEGERVPVIKMLQKFDTLGGNWERLDSSERDILHGFMTQFVQHFPELVPKTNPKYYTISKDGLELTTTAAIPKDTFYITFKDADNKFNL